ncbi:MAG TPA: hypothetical protein VHN14_27080, partial [Kofleriaceae bacterium]|nr:hypothetical protein [Kofleriaceae bacterium]
SGVSWDSVLRIDGMVKLMLEQHGITYLPIESVSMQERVRAVEFVLGRCGLPIPKPATRRPQPFPETLSPGADVLKASIESWPYALVDAGDHEA